MKNQLKYMIRSIYNHGKSSLIKKLVAGRQKPLFYEVIQGLEPG